MSDPPGEHGPTEERMRQLLAELKTMSKPELAEWLRSLNDDERRLLRQGIDYAAYWQDEQPPAD